MISIFSTVALHAGTVPNGSQYEFFRDLGGKGTDLETLLTSRRIPPSWGPILPVSIRASYLSFTRREVGWSVYENLKPAPDHDAAAVAANCELAFKINSDRIFDRPMLELPFMLDMSEAWRDLDTSRHGYRIGTRMLPVINDADDLQCTLAVRHQMTLSAPTLVRIELRCVKLSDKADMLCPFCEGDGVSVKSRHIKALMMMRELIDQQLVVLDAQQEKSAQELVVEEE